MGRINSIRIGTEHELDDIKVMANDICQPIQGYIDNSAYAMIILIIMYEISQKGEGFTLQDAYAFINHGGLTAELVESKDVQHVVDFIHKDGFIKDITSLKNPPILREDAERFLSNVDVGLQVLILSRVESFLREYLDKANKKA